MNRFIFTKRPFSPFLLSCIVSVLLIFALQLPYAIAQENSRISMSVEAGFDNYYKENEAVPVYVTVSNQGTAVDGDIRIIVKSGFGDELLYRAPVSLATQSNKRIAIPVQFGRPANSLTVELWDGNRLVAAAKTSGALEPLADETFLYGVVTPSAGEFDFLERANGRYARAEAAYLTIADLPEIAPVWNGLDMLILDDVDTATLSTAQRDGLNSWLENGGQLMLMGGAGWRKTTAVFPAILPVTVGDVESVDDLAALSKQFRLPFRDEGPYLLNNSTLQAGGELLLHQDGQPILARRAVGAGSVYFLAVDPKLAPLLDWDGSPLLWEMLQEDMPANPHMWDHGFQMFYAAETAVNILPSLALPSTILLIFFLFLYIITIGPVNYFMLSRRDILSRAWITIPAISLAFSIVAYFIGFQLKGNDNIINELSVATGRVDTKKMQVESMVGLYSPRRAGYDLVFPYNSIAAPFDTGMGVSAGRMDAIARNSALTMENVRVDIGNMEMFLAQSYQPMPAVSGQAILSRGDGELLLDVTLANESDVQFEGLTLLVGSRAYELDDFGENGRLTFTRTYFSTSTDIQSLGPFRSVNSHPLQDNSEIILRTSNYYDDSTLQARYQLLTAIEPEYEYPPSSTLYHYRTDVITLIAWADESQINAALADKEATVYHTTLYLIDIPLVVTE